MTKPNHSPTDPALRAKLDALSQKLAERQQRGDAANRAKQAEDGSMAEAGRAMSLGFRAITELVVGLGVGAAVGYGLDQLTGTTPLLMILFLFLGMAAGVWNVMRIANGMNSAGARTPPGGGAAQAGGPGAKRPPEPP